VYVYSTDSLRSGDPEIIPHTAGCK
jgi:hypothetical protein